MPEVLTSVPGLIVYSSVPVPPVAVMIIVPSVKPLQLMSVTLLEVTIIWSGSVS